MKNGDDIYYFKDLNAFNQSLYSNLPDSSLGYMDSTTGSDMFDVLEKFLKNTEFLCGSTVIIAAKRYPNKVEIEDLIYDLQRNHVFVYILSIDTPSGGSNPSAMFNVATRTNGYCVFSADDNLQDMFAGAIYLAYAPNQIVASKFAVSGKGSQTVPFKTLEDPGRFDRLRTETIYQDHKVDGSLKYLNYTVTDEYGEKIYSGKDNRTLYTEYRFDFQVYNAVQYYLNIEYEYEEGQQELMVVRMYSFYNVQDYWLPFNN